jgi:sugar lactone lactonase YvrE
MPQFRVVVDRYYTGDTEGSNIKEDVKEVEADGFAVDNSGSLFFFVSPPEVTVTNPDGQVATMPRNPTPIRAFAKGKWLDVEKA